MCDNTLSSFNLNLYCFVFYVAFWVLYCISIFHVHILIFVTCYSDTVLLSMLFWILEFLTAISVFMFVKSVGHIFCRKYKFYDICFDIIIMSLRIWSWNIIVSQGFRHRPRVSALLFFKYVVTNLGIELLYLRIMLNRHYLHGV